MSTFIRFTKHIVVFLCTLGAMTPCLPAHTTPSVQTSVATSENSDQVHLLDQQFLDARRAYQKRSLSTVEQAQHDLGSYPLNEYVELWALTLKLKSNKDYPKHNVDFINFIESHQGQYIGERAASDYLMIVQDRINPALFNQIYSYLQWNQNEPEILAWYYWYNFEKENIKDIESFLKTSSIKDVPLRKLSEKVIDINPKWAWSSIVIQSQKERWQEVRYLINNLPEKLLPAKRATLLSILNNPQRWYKKNKRSLKRYSARTQVLLLLRLRTTNLKLATQVAEVITPTLAPNWQSLMWGLLAYEATVSQSDNGAELFTRAGSRLYQHPLLISRDLTASWAARAYLKTGNWKEVERAISQMSPEMRNNETWIYWRARALLALGRQQDAHKLFKTIASNISFYGKLACDELKIAYPLNKTTTVPITESDQKTWDLNPHIQKAKTLYRLELFFMGHREWNWALRGASAKNLLSATQYAEKEHLIHRMINTGQRISKTKPHLHFLFPMPYQKQITQISHQYGVPAAWVYGIIRQESRFMTSVSSNVGAQGLMQIMPNTAKWLIKKLELAEFKGKPITQLDINIALGSSYLNMLHTDFDQSYALASAAYNAGPLRARQWRKTLKAPLEGAIFIESIPYFETRDYVKNVLSNTFTYASLLNEDLGSFKNFVGVIQPTDGTQPETELP